MHHVYILKCADDSYYVGMTNNLERRVGEHQRGYRAGSYTYIRRPIELVWSCECATRREAVQAEQRIKRLPRAKKELLIREASDAVRKAVKRGRKPRAAETSKTKEIHAK